MQSSFPNIANRRVLVTGHTGFKGPWLIRWLQRLGATICGYALEPATSPNHFEIAGLEDQIDRNVRGDIRNLGLLQETVVEFEPELIIHLAAQTVVSTGYETPIETLDVNVMGTANVLDVIRRSELRCAILCVTSDKCYRNVGQVWGYRECDALGEKDPYSASKGAAEIVVNSYRHSYFSPEDFSTHGVCLASARGGNVIGGGDWTRDALMVDVMEALANNEPVRLRSPGSVRPWQHVLSCLSGYLEICNQMLGGNLSACDGWNIGPMPGNEWTVQQVVERVIDFWGAGSWICPDPVPPMKEAAVLRLSIDKAISELGWTPLWDVETSLRKTVEWYQAFRTDPNRINRVTDDQLHEFDTLYANQKNRPTEEANLNE